MAGLSQWADLPIRRATRPGSLHTISMTDEQTTDSFGLTRRQALAAAAALCGLGAVVGASSAQAAPRAGALRVRLSAYPALSKVGGVAVVGNLGSIPVAVVRTGRTRCRAFNRRCPHAGATVIPQGSGFLCPAHGSVFTKTGARVSGPTPTGLIPLKTKLSRGLLTITV